MGTSKIQCNTVCGSHCGDWPPSSCSCSAPRTSISAPRPLTSPQYEQCRYEDGTDARSSSTLSRGSVHRSRPPHYPACLAGPRASQSPQRPTSHPLTHRDRLTPRISRCRMNTPHYPSPPLTHHGTTTLAAVYASHTSPRPPTPPTPPTPSTPPTPPRRHSTTHCFFFFFACPTPRSGGASTARIASSNTFLRPFCLGKGQGGSAGVETSHWFEVVPTLLCSRSGLDRTGLGWSVLCRLLRTAQHRTTPHHTAPHRTTPHHTASPTAGTLYEERCVPSCRSERQRKTARTSEQASRQIAKPTSWQVGTGASHARLGDEAIKSFEATQVARHEKDWKGYSVM
jgi:hypothetical protein